MHDLPHRRREKIVFASYCMYIHVSVAIVLEATENLPLINSDYKLLLQLLAIKEDTQFFQFISGSV